MNNSHFNTNNEDPKEKTNLDDWNDRLDENLEPEDSGDEAADEAAARYSDEEGSGDQSDDQGLV